MLCSVISSGFHRECAYDCILEYKFALSLIIVYSPWGALLDCFVNYIFNRFPGKQTQKVNVHSRLGSAFK